MPAIVPPVGDESASYFKKRRTKNWVEKTFLVQIYKLINSYVYRKAFFWRQLSRSCYWNGSDLETIVARGQIHQYSRTIVVDVVLTANALPFDFGLKSKKKRIPLK